MNSPWTHPLSGLLAQAGSSSDGSKRMVELDKLPQVSEHVNQGNLHDLPWELLLVGIGLLMLAIVFVSLKRWWKQRQDDPSGTVLYSAIARKAGLKWPDRLLLWRIARACDLPTPTTLLLARGALRHYVDQYAASKSPAQQRKLSARREKIESQLFA